MIEIGTNLKKVLEELVVTIMIVLILLIILR